MRKPDLPSNAGNRAAAANWGRLLLGYFLLATQKKVTSCRATPDGFDFVVYASTGSQETAFYDHIDQ
jgi:hypothetical protein